MVATTYAGAVRAGTQAAARLQRDLGLRPRVEGEGGNVDVFGAIGSIDLPLLLRPLEGLLGAYLNDPTPGVLVTTQRPMSIQRFTAAHELGHFCLGHEPSLDDEGILRRMAMPRERSPRFQEVEADAFAVEFMMPRWLFHAHASRQGWTTSDFLRPNRVYQLSLRLGASYAATCHTLARHRLITTGQANSLLETRPRTLKVDLLDPYQPSDYRGDVWLLTERDTGARIDGSRNDHFVIRLKEHSGGGYLWNFDQLRESGFAIVGDELAETSGESVGDNVLRRVTAAPPEDFRGQIELAELRPWDPDTPLNTLDLKLDLTGPEEEGLSRADRRILLEAA